MSTRIRVLIVDDSVVVRKGLRLLLQSDPQIEVIGEARNGQEAVEHVATLRPDLVTMDIEMPVMDGLAALRHIMASHPLPVIVFSTLSTEGADITLDALDAGAIDFIPKDLGALTRAGSHAQSQLIAKIKSIVFRQRAKNELIGKQQKEFNASIRFKKVGIFAHSSRKQPVQVVLIGSSTGGPQALHEIVSGLPRDFPAPVVIVQHMPEFFTASLATRLNHAGVLEVSEAVNNDWLERGRILIAPGGKQLLFQRDGKGVRAYVRQHKLQEIYKPSVDVSAQSLAGCLRGRAIGVMLTGMGRDGLQGFKRLKEKQAFLIAQSEQSCTIYGMPRAVVESGIADAVLAPRQIAAALIDICVQ